MAKRTRIRPYRGNESGYRVIHDGERHLVVDKGPGLLVQRAQGAPDPCLLDLLGAEWGFVHSVHRLDRDVSGLMVFARDKAAAEQLRRQFRARTAERRYLAAVHGRPAAEQGRLEHHLAQNTGNYRMYAVPPGKGKQAVLHWFVVEGHADSALLEVVLETGVKNQIRVQLALAGHPLQGEQKYTGESSRQMDRIFLHAALLSFDAPGSGDREEWSSPLPRDLLRWRERLREGRSSKPPAGPSPRRPGRPRRRR
ncbi:MAG: RNA pseudouridine synthase [Myxococcota bacterium]